MGNLTETQRNLRHRRKPSTPWLRAPLVRRHGFFGCDGMRLEDPGRLGGVELSFNGLSGSGWQCQDEHRYPPYRYRWKNLIVEKTPSYLTKSAAKYWGWSSGKNCFKDASPFLVKADPSENPITQWDLWEWIVWVWDAVKMGAAELGGGGIFSTVLSKWERDNSTIRKLSTPIKCALQIRLILLSPILTHKLGSKKVNLQVIYILYTGNTCLFSRKFWIPRTSSLILGGGFKFSQMSAKCFHDDSNVLFLAPNCGDDRNWRICLQNIETTT